MERFDVVIAGAGLAGLSAAYSLASERIDVLVVERGDYPGAKNVTGGRIYLKPVRKFLPDVWDQAPLERHVSKEILTVMGQSSSTSVQLLSEKFNQQPYHSFTVLRAKFDRWLADKAKEKGATIVTKNRVDDLIYEEGKVAGIVVGADKIYADVVIAADGALSLMAQKAGLRGKCKAEDFAIGVKEVVELSPKIIEERFNLNDGEGAAQLFIGLLTRGMFGGGFLYTNIDSISWGMVVKIKDLMRAGFSQAPYQLTREMRNRPEISSLLKGGQAAEYSAHIIPEGGAGTRPRLYSDGIVVVGDAAGLALNTGITVRGMDFAIASGVIAAQAVKRAKENDDFSSRTLRLYQDLLMQSFVGKDLHTFRQASHFLNNPRLFTTYPQGLCDLLEKLMLIDENPKQKLSTTAFRELRKMLGLAALKDVAALRRI